MSVTHIAEDTQPYPAMSQIAHLCLLHLVRKVGFQTIHYMVPKVAKESTKPYTVKGTVRTLHRTC